MFENVIGYMSRYLMAWISISRQLINATHKGAAVCIESASPLSFWTLKDKLNCKQIVKQSLKPQAVTHSFHLNNKITAMNITVQYTVHALVIC